MGIYVEVFRESRKYHFQEKTEISRQYNIDYDIYINRSK